MFPLFSSFRISSLLRLVHFDAGSRLRSAAKFGHLQKVKEILAKSPEALESRDKMGSTPLLQAVINGQQDVVEYLVQEARAQIDAKLPGSGLNSLIAAASFGNSKICEMLIKAGAQVDAEMSQNFTALTLAATSNHPDVVRLLLEAGADPNKLACDGSSILMGSITNKADHSVILMLLDAGANVAVRTTTTGLTALMSACAMKNEPVIKLLISKNSDLVNIQGKGGFTALSLACASGADVSTVEYLIKAGADPNFISKVDNSGILHCAVQGGNLDLVKYLMRDCNLDPLQVMTNGTTLLMIASRFGHHSIAEFLIGNTIIPIDAKSVPEGATALMLAAQGGHKDIVQMLLEHGADVEAKLGNGSNVFSLVGRNAASLLDLLLEKWYQIQVSKGSRSKFILYIQCAVFRLLSFFKK